MDKLESLPGRVSPAARTAMLEYLQKNGSPEAVLSLLKVRIGDAEGQVDENTKEEWTYGYYEQWNIRGIERELKTVGKPVLYEIDGLIFAIPQCGYLDEIVGKKLVLDSSSHRVAFRDCTD